MAEEENVTPQQPQVNPEDQNLLDAMDEYKKTHSISNEEYNRVLERNKELTQNWAKGNMLVQAQKDTDTVESLRNDLFAEDRKELTNLESAQKILKLRSKLLDEGKRDPFVNTDAKRVTAADFEAAERVAEGLQDMVDKANGDPDVFNSLLGRQVDGGMSGKRKYNY